MIFTVICYKERYIGLGLHLPRHLSRGVHDDLVEVGSIRFCNRTFRQERARKEHDRLTALSGPNSN